MRLISLLKYSLVRQLRDRPGLFLTLLTAPFLVVLYGLLHGQSTTTSETPGLQFSAFDIYVPGLLVFAIIMLVFSAAMTVTREVENGTLERLRITRLSTAEMMVGLSFVQLLMGVCAVVLTFAAARLMGFNPCGSIWLALFLAVIGCFASVGIGMIVASLSRSLVRSFLIASVSMFLMVLFSGIVFPQPEIELTTIAGKSIGLLAFLPTTHLVHGLEKVLFYGVGMEEILFETGALLLLSVLYFTVGVYIFRRTSYTFFVDT